MSQTSSHTVNEDSQSRGPLFARVAIAMIVLPSIAIVLRFWSRSIITSKEKFWWDDWLALASWGCCVSNCISALILIPLGIGERQLTSKLVKNYSFVLLVWHVAAILFEIGIAVAKLSALAFYLRVFEFSRMSRQFKLAYWTIFALVVVYAISRVLQQNFSCIPPNKAWRPTLKGHCISSDTNVNLLIAGATWDVATDLGILILPMPMIVGLGIPHKRKAALIVAFACGYITWTTSVARTVTYVLAKRYVNTVDAGWHVIPALATSLTEIGISTVSICVPTWFNFFARLKKGGFTALFHSHDLVGHLDSDEDDEQDERQGDEQDEEQDEERNNTQIKIRFSFRPLSDTFIRRLSEDGTTVYSRQSDETL